MTLKEKAEAVDLRVVGKAIALKLGYLCVDAHKNDKETTGQRLTSIHFEEPGTKVTFYAHIDRWKGRLEFRGIYPRHLDGSLYDYGPQSYDKEVRPSISADVFRDPGKIAADVERRFLPDFTRQYHEAVVRRDKDVSNNAKRKNLCKKIAAAFGKDATVREERGSDFTVQYPQWSPLSGEIKPWLDGEASIEARNVPMKQALQIARILGTVEPKED